MKRKTVKRMLVERMISKGNGLRYSQMIKELMKITRGEDYQYDWRTDRGYYATNFSKNSKGYMVTGCGDCGVYKGSDGKWHAKIYSTEEMLNHKVDTIIEDLSNAVVRMSRELQNELHMFLYDDRNILINDFRYRVNNHKKWAKQSLVRAYNWSQKQSK